MRKRTGARGFTLVEMVVAVALFSVVMVICVATLLSLVSANRKAQALQSVMNNLNISIDGMARAIRQGDHYYCSAAGTTPVAGTLDCKSGNTQLTFEHYGGDINDLTDQWVYKFEAGQILKSKDGGPPYAAITSPEVTINDMNFYVSGSDPADTLQPTVIIVVKGTAGRGNVKTKTTFHVEAAAVQRRIDL